jgi:hypothetical protein
LIKQLEKIGRGHRRRSSSRTIACATPY